jgi:hypothetical protein
MDRRSFLVLLSSACFLPEYLLLGQRAETSKQEYDLGYGLYLKVSHSIRGPADVSKIATIVEKPTSFVLSCSEYAFT